MTTLIRNYMCCLVFMSYVICIDTQTNGIGLIRGKLGVLGSQQDGGLLKPVI